MKQHITVEQLAELELDLRETDKIIDKFNLPRVSLDYMDLPAIARWVSKQITIGKMIEIISKFVYDIEVFIEHRYLNTKIKITGDNGEKEYKSEWLCDALWECIKDILKEVK